VVHYNWHWFPPLGTGEIANNGTHEIDVCRWALGVDRCTRVTSTGGRYHFDDDWEFPDTQEAAFEFPAVDDHLGGAELQRPQHVRPLARYRILGTTGSVVMDRDGYVVYDLKNTVVKQNLAAQAADGLNISAADDIDQPAYREFSWTPFAPARRSTSRSRKARRASCCAIWATSRNGRVARSASIRDRPHPGRRCSDGVLAARVRAGLDSHSLNPDRFFDSDPSIRRVARALYEETRALPIVSPHGHVDPRILAENTPFPNPASPDCSARPLHPASAVRQWCAARSVARGRAAPRLAAVRRALLPVSRHAERGVARLRTKTWYSVFGLRYPVKPLHGFTTRSSRSSKRPRVPARALFERFNIEVLATTDAATDSLEHHCAIRESGWKGRVIPTFRPDAQFKIFVARVRPARGERLRGARPRDRRAPCVLQAAGVRRRPITQCSNVTLPRCPRRSRASVSAGASG